MKERCGNLSLVIFSCSPRSEEKSNTASIAKAFKQGYEEFTDETCEIYYLCKRKYWDIYMDAFKNNQNIIFAMPLFVECIPGLLMEFLEFLPSKNHDTNIAFIVQGGFEEAHQLRTCEHYLQRLPEYLNCTYKGTLIKGGMFSLAFASDKSKKKKLQPFVDMGFKYGQVKYFDSIEVSKFAGREFVPKSVILLNKLLKPINKLAWNMVSKKFNPQGKLDDKPYENVIFINKK